MKPGKRGTLHLQALGRFMLLLAIPVAIGALMWLFARQAQRRSEWVAHSLRVQISLERLVADLKNGSSSHRGYLLTSADSFLQAYRSAATASRHEIYDLFALTADDPNQQHFLNELRPIVEYWHRDLESEQELARSGKLDKTTIPAGIEEDRAHLATVLALVDAMYREEDQLLQGRSA
ncbi:MAG: CHASE3 domain-containing protein, partial [Terracidiphilus sp.]